MARQLRRRDSLPVGRRSSLSGIKISQKLRGALTKIMDATDHDGDGLVHRSDLHKVLTDPEHHRPPLRPLS